MWRHADSYDALTELERKAGSEQIRFCDRHGPINLRRWTVLPRSSAQFSLYVPIGQHNLVDVRNTRRFPKYSRSPRPGLRARWSRYPHRYVEGATMNSWRGIPADYWGSFSRAFRTSVASARPSCPILICAKRTVAPRSMTKVAGYAVSCGASQRSPYAFVKT